MKTTEELWNEFISEVNLAWGAEKIAIDFAKFHTKTKLEELEKKIEDKIDKHRKEAVITCQEDCWCWELEEFIKKPKGE